MESAIENKYPIEKLKLELSKAKYNEYKGRTEYYQMVLDILGQVVGVMCNCCKSKMIKYKVYRSDKIETYYKCPVCDVKSDSEIIKTIPVMFGE